MPSRLHLAAIDAGIAFAPRTPRQGPPDVIDKRLNEACNEIRCWTTYDYVLVNDDLQSMFAGLCAILAAEHRRTARAREGIAAFVVKACSVSNDGKRCQRPRRSTNP